MTNLFDLNAPSGQFLAVLLIYAGVVALRCVGYDFLKEDHSLILGCLLTLVRGHVGPGTTK